jgi:hypothetical protein
MLENEETIHIHTTEDGVEEADICAALDEADIKYVVQEFEDHAMDGLFTRTLGHSRIFVLEGDVERALQAIQPVVERFRRSKGEGGQEES